MGADESNDSESCAGDPTSRGKKGWSCGGDGYTVRDMPHWAERVSHCERWEQ